MTTSSSTPHSTSRIRTLARYARRMRIATTSATASTITAGSMSTPATPAPPRRPPLRAPHPTRTGFSDYGGIIVDAGNTGQTATFFVVTPRNIQYDAITDDSSGEDSSPDFFWESKTRFTPRGWTLAIRLPLSSLRYKNADPQTWGILLYRNYPRDHHYQFFSAKLPRGSNCF